MPPNSTFTLRLFLWIRSHRILSPVTKITRRSSCCIDDLSCSGHRVAYWINKSQKPLWGLNGSPSPITAPLPRPRCVNTPRLMSALKLFTRNTCIDILHEFKKYCFQTDLLPHPSCLKKPFLHPPSWQVLGSCFGLPSLHLCETSVLKAIQSSTSWN